MAVVLVTGFLPFGQESRNPSGEIADRLRGSRSRWCSIESTVLPVERERAFSSALLDLGRYRPSLVLALGVGSDRPVIGVERCARNLDDYRNPDEAGAHPRGEPIVPGAPATLRTTIPAEAVATAIRNCGVPALVSEDAGTFLCNHLYYRLLHHASTRSSEEAFRAIFLHLPPLPESVARRDEARASMSLETSERAVRAAVDAAFLSIP
jgi:pyroglutamyl-peptidase